jgi:4-hydroxy-3-polyprenylbenzoate decarboxylase
MLIPGVPLDTLDFTSFTMNLGGKMVLDAQSHSRLAAGPAAAADARKAAPLPTTAPDPRGFDDGVLAHRLAWGGVLVVQVRGQGRGVIERLVQRPEYAGVKLLIAVSRDVPLDDDTLLLWGIFTRFDCARDIVPARTETRGAWLTCRGPLGIDASFKDGYPEPVATPPGVIAKVDGWWR